MPYVKRRYVKCKDCGDTDTLFYAVNRKLVNGKKEIRVSNQCRNCYLEYHKFASSNTYIKNREIYISNKRKRYAKNPDNIKCSSREYYIRNKDEQNRKRILRYENSNNLSINSSREII